jgi:hypothetical protein
MFSEISPTQKDLLVKLVQHNSPEVIMHALNEIRQEYDRQWIKENINAKILQLKVRVCELRDNLNTRELNTIHTRLFKLEEYMESRGTTKPVVLQDDDNEAYITEAFPRVR